MKRILLLLLFISAIYCPFSRAQVDVMPVNQTSLPNIEIKAANSADNTTIIKKDGIQIKRTKKGKTKKPGFNPKASGLTNYQYDDTNYKYNKVEKYIKDNIEYSKSGSTKLY